MAELKKSRYIDDMALSPLEQVICQLAEKVWNVVRGGEVIEVKF